MSLIPCLTNSGPGASLYAAAGASSANPSFSSITLNSDGEIYLPNNISKNASIVGYVDPTNQYPTFLSVLFPSGYIDPSSQPGVWGVQVQRTAEPQANYYADFAAGRLVVLGTNQGTPIAVPLIDSDGNGGLGVNAISTINISTPTLTWNNEPLAVASLFSSLFAANPSLSTIEYPALKKQ